MFTQAIRMYVHIEQNPQLILISAGRYIASGLRPARLRLATPPSKITPSNQTRSGKGRFGESRKEGK